MDGINPSATQAVSLSGLAPGSVAGWGPRFLLSYRILVLTTKSSYVILNDDRVDAVKSEYSHGCPLHPSHLATL